MHTNNITTFALSVGIFALTIVLLILGRDILMPLAISIVIWYLINALSKFFSRIPIANRSLPRWISLSVSLIIIVGALVALGNLIGNNIADVIETAPEYQQNFNNLIKRISAIFGLTEVPSLGQIIDHINFRDLASNFAAGAAGIAANAGIIIIYVLFLLAEQRTFERKLVALFPDLNQQTEIRNLLHKIQMQVQTYVWIKTVMSFLTGSICYIILVLVGLDLALFWAFVIFLLNYIPTVGSLLGIALPSLLALVQFDTPFPFFLVAITLAVTQFCIGNLIEPRLMGRTLNLSPLVVIVTLVVWGNIWGIAGAILCVPITVIAMIIFSHFDRTKAVAIILSGDGKIK